MVQEGQKSITVSEKLYKALEDYKDKTNYNSVAALSQYVLNKYLEEKADNNKEAENHAD